MENKCLSIIVVTMNRADQLKEAIHSCLYCNLPKGTEFIIMDNASTDDTFDVVAALKTETEVEINYVYSKENLGVGAGRNHAIGYASGDYIYVLDDDAVIDKANKDFFMEAIRIFERHPKIASLTTQIYDTAWKGNRINSTHLKLYEGIYKCYMPCGGSHFLRRSSFDVPIYFPNKYGYEEIATAMQAIAKGYENAFYPSLLVIHKPKVNKWINSNQSHFINDFASQYAIKRIFYPKVISPMLWLIYQMRYFKYLRGSHLRKEGQKIIAGLLEKDVNFKRIKWSTLRQLYKDYGYSIF